MHVLDFYFIVSGGQEKIVRAFAEVMKNMARMKACVRPAMCKPYGKQSEALQKSNFNSLQVVFLLYFSFFHHEFIAL